MFNFILKNTEIRAVPEECGHATAISITERNWYNYTVVESQHVSLRRRLSPRGGGTWVFSGGYVPPGTPNWHPVLKNNSPKIDTPL